MHPPMPSPLRLAVLGATGRTGRRLVEIALADGHAVHALARDPAALAALAHPALTVQAGDARDAAAVDRLVAGCDAAISALGGGTRTEPGTARSDGARNAATALLRHGASRFVGVAGGGILDLPGVGLRHDRPGYPEAFRHVSREHLAAWHALRATDATWTLACTGDIVPGARTDAYRVLPDVMPEGGRRITIDDLVDFLLREVVAPRFPNRRVGVAE